MRPLFLPLVPFYGAGVAVRNWFFDIGFLRTHPAGVPVISVGNISMGGVGKTPFIELLARKCVQKKLKAAILSRGYGRQSSGTLVVSNGTVRCAEANLSGDEPAQMASKLAGVVVVVDEDRVRGAAYIHQNFGVGILLLDDGFQHRYLRRDADIVLVRAQDAQEPGRLLPAGDRREPWSALDRATLIGITRCENLDEFQRAKSFLSRRTRKPVIGLTTKVSAFRRASTRFSLDLPGLKGKSIVAFSGVGDPESFDRTLTSLGLEVRKHVVFPDHHQYSRAELDEVENLVASTGSDFLVTTEKDIARLGTGDEEQQAKFERVPLFYVEIEQCILSGEAQLDELLDGVAGRR